MAEVPAALVGMAGAISREAARRAGIIGGGLTSGGVCVRRASGGAAEVIGTGGGTDPPRPPTGGGDDAGFFHELELGAHDGPVLPPTGIGGESGVDRDGGTAGGTSGSARVDGEGDIDIGTDVVWGTRALREPPANTGSITGEY